MGFEERSRKRSIPFARKRRREEKIWIGFQAFAD